MTTVYLLDTNTVSTIVRGKSAAARAKLASLTEDEIACVSVITEAEVRYGLARTPQAHKLGAAVRGFLAKVKILPWGRQEAQVYGELRAKMERAGKSLGNLDMLIAAQAIAAGAVLVSNDRAFLQIEGLLGVVSWAGDV